MSGRLEDALASEANVARRLYAITDKGSSAVGPSIVGLIVDRVGTIRPAFAFLAVLIALPLPLVYIVDVQKGHAEALALSKLLGYRGGHGIAMEDYENAVVHGGEGAEGLLSEHDHDLDAREERPVGTST